ncbi:hypothetical protein J0X19_08490 [Hymenobacter sp. BT186]|uniref:Uncharacterized protein n=1 Tax=Hymenobacter telluris TaxID=2816474 RepID=A0A939EVL0_9BACT|nr:hypothetical protein [Hymenobacter telluris]MBO0357979.1 hypothetical protein [Hymenobacter telluris]MBW3374006.1 hypothetical protein [Hymenobacter norwichensis]
MRQLSIFTLLSLFTIVTSCKQQPAANTAMPKPPQQTASIAPTAPPPARNSAPPTPPALPAVLPAQQLHQFLLEHDVAPLLCSVHNGVETTPYNGFFGTDRHRIEVVLLHVRSDSTQPWLLHVTGKSRFKGKIMNLEGTVELLSIRHQPPLNQAEEEHEKAQESMRMLTTIPATGDNKLVEFYTISGRFDWQEPHQKAGGRFTGQAELDVAITRGNKLLSCSLRKTTGARGADLLFDGKWNNYQSGQEKPFILAENVGGFAEQVLKNFEIGERDVVINPKYAKLGWNEYWENDEWWAEPGTITAQTTLVDGL